MNFINDYKQSGKQIINVFINRFHSVEHKRQDFHHSIHVFLKPTYLSNQQYQPTLSNPTISTDIRQLSTDNIIKQPTLSIKQPTLSTDNINRHYQPTISRTKRTLIRQRNHNSIQRIYSSKSCTVVKRTIRYQPLSSRGDYSVEFWIFNTQVFP